MCCQVNGSSMTLLGETQEDIADEFADGYVRFTIRSNIEFYVDTEAKLQPLVDTLKDQIEEYVDKIKLWQR